MQVVSEMEKKTLPIQHLAVPLLSRSKPMEQGDRTDCCCTAVCILWKSLAAILQYCIQGQSHNCPKSRGLRPIESQNNWPRVLGILLFNWLGCLNIDVKKK